MLGYVLQFEAGFLLLPCIVALIYREKSGFAYLIMAAVCFVIGVCLSRIKGKSKNFFAKEGFASVALSWIVMSLAGCMPFVISGEIPKFIDALGEEEVHILSLQHADGEAVGLAAADDLSVGNGALNMFGNLPQLAVEILARAGQLNAFTTAPEQLKAHFLLHQSDLTGEVGLGDIEGLGGLGKAAPFGDLHKILDSHQIHNITS